MPLAFSHDVTIDSVSYKAALGQDGARQVATTYQPKVASAIQDLAGAPQLDPVNFTTWHRGSGASREIDTGMTAWGENMWTGDPGIALPGPLVTAVDLSALGLTQPVPVRGFSEQDGHVYFISGRSVVKIANGSAAPAIEQDLGATFIAAAMKRFKTSLFVSSGYAGPGAMWEKPAGGGAWTNAVSGVGGVQAGALGTVFWNVGSINAERLVVQSSAEGIRYVSGDPRKDTDYTPASPNPDIELGSFPIATLTATRDHMYIVTQGGVRDLDSSGLAPNLTPEAEIMPMSTNGQASLAMLGWIYANMGYDLLRVRVSNPNEYAEVQWVTPGIGLPNETPVGGYGTAITRHGNWVVYAQYDDQNAISWLSWGRDAFTGYATDALTPAREVGPMVWNSSPIVLRGIKVTALHVSGLIAGKPRLWIAGTDVGGNVVLRWAPLWLRTPYQDLRNGRAAMQFAPTATLTLPAQDWGDDSMPKDLEEIAAEADNLGPGTSLTVSMAKDGDTAYTQVARLTSGPRQVVPLVSAYAANRMTPQIAFAGSAAAPPILRKLSLRANPRADQRQVRTYSLLAGRLVQHRGGDRDEVDPTVRQAALERLQVGSRVTMTDENNAALTVLLKRIGQVTEVEDTAQGERVLAIAVQLIVLRTVGQPFAWDSGVPYDSGRSWS